MDKIAGIDAAIRRYYSGQAALSEGLIEAILYSVDGGGKRIRPLLLLEVLEGFGLTLADAHFDVAAAVEMIHTGSLIHDDLPAMDNDDYRRGRLTNHKKFDEATAILAGDSLFLDAFGLIAEANLPAQVQVGLIQALSRFAGTFGMVGGQALDMAGEGKRLDIVDLQAIHAGKTGALLTFPFLAAGIIAQQSEEVCQHLAQAGRLIGHAFQVRDDILDVTASFEEIGKTPKKDLLAEKSTYPSLLGLDQSYVVLHADLDEATAIFHELEKTAGFDARQILDLVERLRLHA